MLDECFSYRTQGYLRDLRDEKEGANSALIESHIAAILVSFVS